MIVSVHQPQYLPWLGYFDKIDKSDCFVFLDTVQYKVREFQNRNKIRIDNKWIWLTVPVKIKGNARENICDIEIDNTQDWATEHRKSLQSWYSKAPFFKQHFPFFEQVFDKKWDKLSDLNIYIIKYILEQLTIKTPLHFESELKTTKKSTDRILELCQKLNADTYLSGIGGRNYLEEDKFEQANIKLIYQEFEHPVYEQQFVSQEHPFMAYVSALDLLFNAGPKSMDIIRKG